MPVYSWEGRSANGAVVRGDLEAPTRDHALARLKTTRVTVIRVDGGRGEDAVMNVEHAASGTETQEARPPPLRTRRLGVLHGDRHGRRLRVAGPRLRLHARRRQIGRLRDPSSTLHFREIRTVQLVIGGYSQSMAEQMRQVSNVQLVNGIDGLLKADAPAAYQGWTVDQTPVIVAGAFFIPAGLVLLGLALRLVIPRAAAEKMKTSLHAYAAELRRRRGR